MINVSISLTLKFVYFSSKLPLVFLAVFHLTQGAKWSLRERRHVLTSVLHHHVVVARIWILLFPFHHLALRLYSLCISGNTAHLSDSLLLKFTLALLKLLDKDLGLQVTRLNLAYKLLVR